jgi:chaperone required for assembly of F1-ATPase
MKKVYKSAKCGKFPEGFALLLDDKAARTPMGKPFVMRSQPLAEAVAQEWQAQGETIRKETMRLTHIACVAIDLVAERRAAVLEDILPYGDTDLVCYRAGDIPVLAARQAERLDPIVGWAKDKLGVALKVTGDVMPVTQPEANNMQFTEILSHYDDWKLAALACAVKPLGSLTLALALAEGRLDAKTACELSQLEETYETEAWGSDEEKEQKLQLRREDIHAAEGFLLLVLSRGN